MNLAAALDWCGRAADQGSPVAEYELGQIYEHPWETDIQNFAEALKWYRRAADQGYAEAQEELGGMYEFGLGVQRDYGTAEKWFDKADDWISIAIMYDEVAKNHFLAAKWYGKLADEGNRYAKFRLGEMYRDGEGVPKDLSLAHMWFELAARSGYRNADTARDELAPRMTPAQIARAQRLAQAWKSAK